MKKSFKNRMKGALALVCLLWGMTVAVPIKATETGDTTSTDISETGTKSTVNLTIPESLKGHTFAAYQIFKGDVSNGVLSNVKWGDGVDRDNLISSLRSKSIISTTTTDPTPKEVAQAIETYVSQGSDETEKERRAGEIALLISKHLSETSTSIAGTSVSLVPGYYLIKDVTKKTTNPDFTWNESLLQLTSDMKIERKAETPTVKKQVGENNGENGALNYQDVADYSIGDDVPFQITSTVPETTHYDEYTYEFHDTLSKGLNLNEDSIEVLLDGDKLTKGTDYTIVNGQKETKDGCSLHVKISNLKDHGGEEVIVTYTAQLNSNALVGIANGNDTPNTNKVYLAYINHPYTDSDYAVTPEDKVLVLTYKLSGTKKDASDKKTPLKGAEFYLLNTDQKNPSYAMMDATSHKFTGWTKDEKSASKLISGENGGFEIQGLDAGTYYLKEIKAPVGYNIMEGLQSVEVIANKSRVYDFGEATSPVDFNTNSNDANGVKKTSIDQSGTMSVVVENGKGFTMPSTGAFGQTLIYGVGGLLALGGLGIRMARRRHEQD